MELTLTTMARDPERVGRFWAALLGEPLARDERGVLVAATPTRPGLRWVAGGSERRTPSLVHLHVTSATTAAQQRTVEQVLDLGGAHLDVGQLPEEGHVVLADPEGNELCVIEAGNGFLAGCGLLGELACDGSRALGLFWSEALGWPLVWDQDEETAVQSPAGGTKVAWGGPPQGPRSDWQWFELTVDDVAAEVDRLLALGAVASDSRDGATWLSDPDGSVFRLG